MLLDFKQKQLFEKATKYYDNGEFEKAIKIYQILEKKIKDNHQLFFLLGTANLQIGKIDIGIRYLDDFLKSNPNNISAILNRGNAYKNLKKYEKALDDYNKIIDIEPNFSDAHNNKGIVLQELQKLDEAIISFDRAIKINPNHFFAYNNKGIALKNLQHFEEAILNFDKAIKINPGFVDAYNSRGNVYKNLKLYDKALSDYEKIFKLKPDYDYILGKLLHCKMFLSDWSNFDFLVNKVKNSVKNGYKSTDPFSFLGFVDNPKSIRLSAEIFAQETFNNNLRIQNFTKHNLKKPKVAYFSADFHDHPTLHLMMDVFRNHNKSKFDFFAFSFGPEKNDKWSEEIKNYFSKFIKINKISDKEAVNLIRELNIDIAIDLKGYTSNHRCSIFSSRVAPIQINYLGYPGTTAIKNMDYIIADEITIPKENFKYFSEKVLYLPNCYQANMSQREIAATNFTRSDFGLPENGIIYCSFNNNYKITPDIFDSWMEILHKVNNSFLWILKTNDVAEKNLRNEAEKRGVNAKRIIFTRYLQNDQHLDRLSLADLFLDTFPYNAHTTASDALRMGVPLITLAGNSFQSRVAASILKNSNMDELITYDINDYKKLAIDLGLNPHKLKNVKKNLKNFISKSPLFDSINFTNDLENLYLEILKTQIT